MHVDVMRSKVLHALAMLTLTAAASLFAQAPAKNSAGRKPAPGAEVVRGKEIYDAECEICHYSASTLKKVGPGLKGLTGRAKFANGIKVNDEGLRRWIEKGGKDMPGFQKRLSPEKTRDLIAYLKTL